MRPTAALCLMLCSCATAGSVEQDPREPAITTERGLPLLSVEGGLVDSWDVDMTVEGALPLEIAGTRTVTESGASETGDDAETVGSIRATADFSTSTSALPNIQGGGTSANWPASGRVIIDQIFCVGCTETTTGTARIDGSGYLEIRLREWARGRYRWSFDDTPGSGVFMAPASITATFSRISAGGPEPSFPLVVGFSPERTFKPGLYVVEFDVKASSSVNFTWGPDQPTNNRRIGYSVLATLNVDEILPPPAEYDRDADGAMSVNDLCLFINDPTDLTGDGVVDQSDIDEFAMTLEVILGDIPDADGDGIPDACEASCNAADLAEPFGALDFTDVVAFLTAFGAMDAPADLAPPTGVFDFSDVVAFLGAFGAGCP